MPDHPSAQPEQPAAPGRPSTCAGLIRDKVMPLKYMSERHPIGFW